MNRAKALPAAGLAALLLAGCAAPSAAPGGVNVVFDTAAETTAPATDLTFFGFKYEALNVTAIEDQLHGYMDLYPDVNITYESIKGNEYYEVLNKRIATGNADDIFMVNHAAVLELGAAGELADLSDITTLDDFSPLAKSQILADGSVNYLPTSISAFGLYCNMDLLEQHGQKVPENLAELTEVCDYFVRQGVVPVVANNDISLKTVALAKGLLPCYQQADPAAAIAAFNTDPDALAAALAPGLALVEQMLANGWVDSAEAAATEKTCDDLALFAAGDRPFMLTGVWAVPRVRALNPDLDFTVTPYPILEDGSVLVVNVDTRVSVSADSPNLAAAKQFVEYITQKDVMWEFVDSQCSFSPLEDNHLANDAAIQSINPYLTNGRCILGSDDNLQYPIWDISRACIKGMLAGDSAAAATANLRALLAEA